MALSCFYEPTTTLKSNFSDCFKVSENWSPISLLFSHYSLIQILSLKYGNIVIKLILHLLVLLFMHFHTPFYSLYLLPSFKIRLKKSPGSFLHSTPFWSIFHFVFFLAICSLFSVQEKNGSWRQATHEI